MHESYIETLYYYTYFTGEAHAQFTTQPVNTTVNFGEIVEFECRVRVDGHFLLHLYMVTNNGSSTTNIIQDETFNRLDSREFFANVNNTLGRLWILMNARTIPLFYNFFCGVIYGNHYTLLSNVAYVDVKYPECDSKSLLSKSETTTVTLLSTLSLMKLSSTLLSIKPTSTQMQDLLISTLLGFQPCTCGTRNCKYNSYTTVVKINYFFVILIIVDATTSIKKVDSNETVLYYQAAFGVCLIIVFLMAVVLAIIVLRIYAVHRIKIHGKS